MEVVRFFSFVAGVGLLAVAALMLLVLAVRSWRRRWSQHPVLGPFYPSLLREVWDGYRFFSDQMETGK